MTNALLLLSFVMGTAGPAAAPLHDLAKDPKLDVAGVGLGTSLRVVKAILGPPQQEIDEAHDPDFDMGMGPSKTLRYDGVVIEVCKPEGKADFHVWRMVVTGPSRKLTAGIYVGMSKDAAIKMIGVPTAESRDDDGTVILHYGFHAFDGWYWLKIRNSAVVEIGMTEDWS